MDDPDATLRGATIRRLRKAQGMNLVSLAEKAELSLSFISQVERGLTNPSINSLRKIAVALGTPLSSFFEEGFSNGGPIMKKKHRKVLINTDSRLTYQLLSSNPGHRVELLLTRLEVGSASSKKPMAHKGDEAALVLQGACSIEIANDAYELEEGDSIYINENTPHKTTNTGSIPLVIISAISPPGF